MKKKKLINLSRVLLLMAFFSVSTTFSLPMVALASPWVSEFRPHGGYVDDVIFQVYDYDNKEMALALKEGAIDAIAENLGTEFLPGLVANPDVNVAVNPSTNFRVIALNSGKFPTNITAFRRAFAFALDKTRINYETMGGAGIPIDTQMPESAQEWEIESTLPTHFYESDIESGNATLERAGFIDMDGDGWREYDMNGNRAYDAGIDLDHQDCAIELLATEAYEPAIITINYAAEALRTMGINATAVEKDFMFIIDSMMDGTYSACALTRRANTVNPFEGLFLDFRSGQSIADSFWYFNNVTVDAAIDEMMAATTLEEVKVETAEVLHLLNYEQPLISVYNNVFINAYRTDKFEGFFNFMGQGIARMNPYFTTKIHLKESEGGPYGSTFRCGITDDFFGTNIVQNYQSNEMFLNCVYERLWQRDPNNWDPIPQLAYDWTIEQITAGGGFQDGQKFTFYLYPNATWHDGQPVTSVDVEYSFETIWPSSSSYGYEFANIYRVDRPTDYIVEIYSNKSGYSEWGRVTKYQVLPKHIWEIYAPDFESVVPAGENMTGSGPYKWVDRVPREYIHLSRHTGWHLDARFAASLAIREESPELEESPIESPTSEEVGSPSASPGFEIYVVITMFAVLATITLYLRPRRSKRKVFK